jgi:hypothetical protein
MTLIQKIWDWARRMEEYYETHAQITRSEWTLKPLNERQQNETEMYRNQVWKVERKDGLAGYCSPVHRGKETWKHQRRTAA